MTHAATLSSVQLIDSVVASCGLARWQAWRSPRSTQRGALNGLGEDVTAIFGGNRSGKTELNRALAVAFALGRDHPAVVLWAHRNGFDLGQIPPGPGKVWLVALSSGDSIRYHRPQVDRLLPGGRFGRVKWYNQNGRGEARCLIYVPGYDQPAEICFKAADQGRRGLQGDECRYIGFDEEPPYECFEEASYRGGAEPLRLVISMTPLKGLTWVFDRFVAKHIPGEADWSTAPEEGIRCHWLDFLDNPMIDPAFRKQQLRRLAKLDPARRAARQKGLFGSIEGRAYPMWSREIHVVEPFQIPAEWPKYRGLDFGFRHPACCLWAAVSPAGQVVIYRCLYETELTTPQLARRLAELEGDERFEMSWADPSRPEAIRELRISHDQQFWRGRRPIQDGIDAAASLLAREAQEWEGDEVTEWGDPGCIVFDHCTDFIREIERYTRPAPSSDRRDASERPLPKDDHAMDAFRYLAMGLRRYL